MAVHGWLILPWEQPVPSSQHPAVPVSAWFVHHTPEFWTDSPHNFQIILQGTMTPMSTADNETFPIDIPYPPASDMLVDEFTITPPEPFSLNDLLTGKIQQLIGVVYNGSFDTPYERYAVAIATLDIQQLTTATYLNISGAISNYDQMQYLSYPRNPGFTSGESTQHFYLSHQIHSAPDFDQVVHVTTDTQSCTCTTCGASSSLTDLISAPGAAWAIDGLPNDITDRLLPNTATGSFSASLMGTPDGTNVACKFEVLEQIHCVVGPGFSGNC